LRNAAAAALSRIGTPDALTVLDEASASRSRGVRSAARAHLTPARARRPAHAGEGEA
jgi:HEAT repeat protein